MYPPSHPPTHRHLTWTITVSPAQPMGELKKPSTDGTPSLYFWVYHGSITLHSTLNWLVILYLKKCLTKESVIWNFEKNR